MSLFCNRLRKGAIWSVLGLGLPGVISCDKTFDLSDISTDITVGGSLTMPIGTTDTLHLSRLIDLTDKLKIDETGAYALESDGTLSVEVAEVDGIRISDLSGEPVEVPLSVPGLGDASVGRFPLSLPVSETMKVNSEVDVPDEVERISKIEFDPITTHLRLDLSLADANAFSKLGNLRVEDFEFRFPKMIVFAPGIAGMNYATNTLHLDRNFSAGGNMDIPLPVIGLVGLPEVAGGKLTFVDAIPCSGTLKADAANISASDFDGFMLTIEFVVPEFDINRVEGTVNTSINIDADRIAMGELPDLLTDENTEININAVCISVDVENPTGIPFDASLLLTALDKSGNPINEQVRADVPVAKAADYGTPTVSKLWLTNSETMQAPAGYKKVLVPNLNRLIGKVPEYISVEPTAKADCSQEHFIELCRSYNTKVEYGVNMPFDFGENSKIVYRETVDNLYSDLDGIAGKVPALEVDADFFSTIPLELKLTVTPYDISGNDMSEVLDYTEELTLEPGSETAPLQKRGFELKERVPGALKNLERIEMVVEGDTRTASSVLKPSQYLLVKMKAKLPEGLTITED